MDGKIGEKITNTKVKSFKRRKNWNINNKSKWGHKEGGRREMTRG